MNQQVHRKNSHEYPNMSEAYENLALNRWISIVVLNRLGNFCKLDTDLFFRLQQASHGSIPDYLVRLDNIDLSGHKFEGDTPNYNLTNAHLTNTIFHGTFYGTNFCGADLSGSVIKQGTHFNGCNFHGSILTGIQTKSDSPYSPRIYNCIFSKCKLNNGRLSNSHFGECEFTDADFSGTNIGGAIFSSANMADVQCDEKTLAKNIELLGKDDGSGFNKEWDELKSNKALVEYILSKLDPKLKEIILRDNPSLK